MKTANDPRHLSRIRVMQDLFAWDFNHETNLVSERSKEVVGDLGKIDHLITEAAPQWPLEKINKIDLSILRQAVFELRQDDDVPEKVIIDEAVELGKEYGSESSPSFINGVLGKLMALRESGDFTKE